MKITVVIDSPKSWFSVYGDQLVEKLSKEHKVNKVYGIKSIEPSDIVFLMSITKMVPNDILKKSKHNIVVHASDLPTGKGWSPMPWQIIEGKRCIPLTLFEATECVDSGAYYIKDNIELTGLELLPELRKKLSSKIIEMCIEFVDNYNMMKPIQQEGKETFYSKRGKENSELDINKTIFEQFNLLRTVDNENYPAFFWINEKKYILKIYTDEENV